MWGGVKFNHFSLVFSFSLNSLVDPLCPKVLKIFQTMQFFTQTSFRGQDARSVFIFLLIIGTSNNSH